MMQASLASSENHQEGNMIAWCGSVRWNRKHREAVAETHAQRQAQHSNGGYPERALAFCAQKGVALTTTLQSN